MVANYVDHDNFETALLINNIARDIVVTEYDGVITFDPLVIFHYHINVDDNHHDENNITVDAIDDVRVIVSRGKNMGGSSWAKRRLAWLGQARNI